MWKWKNSQSFYQANKYNYYGCILWISFDEFRNIEYLVKSGFGEVHKATCINYVYYNRLEDKYYDIDKEVMLKRIHNSSVKIVDILNEVK